MTSSPAPLMPFRISRSFTYQIPGQSDPIMLSDYDELGSVIIVSDKAVVTAPTYAMNRQGYNFHATERVILHKDKTSNICSMTLKLFNENGSPLYDMKFVAGPEVIKTQDFKFPKMKFQTPSRYKVRKVHCEFNKSEVWGICEFEIFIPVVRNGVVCDELYSLTCYEIDAEVVALDEVY